MAGRHSIKTQLHFTVDPRPAFEPYCAAISRMPDPRRRAEGMTVASLSPHPCLVLAAGEASGDLHGATLATALRKQAPDWRLVGIGGPRMAAAGVEVVADPTPPPPHAPCSRRTHRAGCLAARARLRVLSSGARAQDRAALRAGADRFPGLQHPGRVGGASPRHSDRVLRASGRLGVAAAPCVGGVEA